MRCAEVLVLVVAALLLLAGCGGGGNSVETRCVGNCSGLTPGQAGPEVVVSEPSGDNTVEVRVDRGPDTGFALGVTNLPYVSVRVCAPGSSTACTTVDHVFLDTGSIGFRVLKSAVASIGLPLTTKDGGTVAECYPFVIGAVWGPLARADVALGGELAANIPVQLIDDGSPAQPAAPADCTTAANGELLSSATRLQAKGVLGVGMLRYDCGLACEAGSYAGAVTLYQRCDSAGCTALAVPAEEQLANPVAHFAVNNNGTLIVLPAVPDNGASLARGRLVFGIGTQTNNQPPAAGTLLRVQTDPTTPDYLYVASTIAGRRYANSYFDSGSNGLFFEDAVLPTRCVGSGAGSSWYCPASTQARSALLSDPYGNSATVPFSIVSADLLFAAPNVAYATLGGRAGASDPDTFVWGLPFFYGRTVYTSIWGQSLATNGPWVAF